jgi:hypothetical protein
MNDLDEHQDDPTDIAPPSDHERRHSPQRLHPEDIKAIANAVLDDGFQRITTEVGTAVLKKLMWIVGMGVLAFGIWLAGKEGMTK